MFKKIRNWFRRRQTVAFDPDTDTLFVLRADGTSYVHGPWNEDPTMILAALYLRELFTNSPYGAAAREALRGSIPPEIQDRLTGAKP